MRISAQDEHGLRILLRIGDSESGSMSITEISKEENISKPNVSKLCRKLRQVGFITSKKGNNGGYTLARSSDEITVFEVIEAMGGPFYEAQFCEQKRTNCDPCPRISDCSIRSIWMYTQKVIETNLSKVSLQDLMNSEKNVFSLLESFGYSM